MWQYILQNFSLSSIVYIYLVVKFLFCLCFCFFHVYLLPVMVNKDVYLVCRAGECSINHHHSAVSGSIHHRFLGELEVHQQSAEEGSSLPPCEWVSFRCSWKLQFRDYNSVCPSLVQVLWEWMTVKCYSKADLLSWLTRTCYLQCFSVLWQNFCIMYVMVI